MDDTKQVEKEPAAVIATENREQWQASDGQAFTYRQWPEDAPKDPQGILVAIHGLSGAADDFVPMAEKFVPAGWVVYAPNLRGMGKDPVEKRRGDLRDYRRLTDDVREFAAFAANRHAAGTPLFLAGESLGGAAVAHAAAADPQLADGLVLIAPVLKVEAELPTWKRWLLRAALVIAPGKRIDISRVSDSDEEFDAARVTRLESRQKEMENSQHAVDRFTLANLAGMFRFLNAGSKRLAEVRQPVLILYAGEDIFTKPDELETLARRAVPLERLTLQLYPEAKHNLLFDPDTPQALETTLQWLDQVRQEPSPEP